jgi:hypothetical protein
MLLRNFLYPWVAIVIIRLKTQQVSGNVLRNISVCLYLLAVVELFSSNPKQFGRIQTF